MSELTIRLGKLFHAKIFLVVLTRIPPFHPERDHRDSIAPV